MNNGHIIYTRPKQCAGTICALKYSLHVSRHSSKLEVEVLHMWVDEEGATNVDV